MVRVYLDACTVLRLLDDQSQERVQVEAAAVEQIFQGIAAKLIVWIASEALRRELGQNQNAEERFLMLQLLRFAGEVFDPEPQTYTRAEAYRVYGLDEFDALHLACAEDSGCSALLTTDDRFLRRAARLPLGGTRTLISNPVDWIARSDLWRS